MPQKLSRNPRFSHQPIFRHSLYSLFLILRSNTSVGIKFKLELVLVITILRLIGVLVISLGDYFTTSLLLHLARFILLLSQHPRLLDGIGHHLLLLEALLDVVPVELEIALFAESKQDLRAEAAAKDVDYGQDNQQVGALLHPMSHSSFRLFFVYILVRHSWNRDIIFIIFSIIL